MKQSSRLRTLLACAAILATQTAVAANQNWFGTWKLNQAQSHLTGPSITILRTASGYRFDFGAVRFDVGDDGRDYPTVPTRSTSIKPISKREWFRVHKVNGKEVDHSMLQVTPDQRSLLIHTVVTGPNGETHESDDRLKRVGSGKGLAGTWRSTVAGINVSKTIVLSDARDGRIRWSFPEDGQYYVIEPNGKPAAYEGPRSVPGVMVQLQTVSAIELRWTEFINGKPYVHGDDRLSADRKRLTEITYPVASQQDEQEAVYDKR